MARLVLITGGSRSGKSEYARRLAESLNGPRAFVATCPVLDEEMADRIRRHQAERSESDWKTLEEPVAIENALASEFPVLLVDCVTLWVNNLMFQAQQEGRNFSEHDISIRCENLLKQCRDRAGTVIFVTNEVGSGIIPDNYSARLYRDLVGRCNQMLAAEADEVSLVACGLPIHLKKGLSQ